MGIFGFVAAAGCFSVYSFIEFSAVVAYIIYITGIKYDFDDLEKIVREYNATCGAK